MEHVRGKRSAATLDTLLGEASWLLSHAEALTDYGRTEEAQVELTRAAQCEEQVACLLDAAGREDEAVVHRVSAAACYEHVEEYARAVTLLRAALSATPPDEYRRRLEQQVARCLLKANEEACRSSPKQTASRRR